MSFKCKICGKCCKDIILPLGMRITDDEKRWIEYHGIEVIKKDIGIFIKINNKCSKLKNGKCLIYKDRPDVCRRYNCKDNKDFL